MKLNHKDITLLIPIYNTDIDCLYKHYTSIKQFPEIKKIYWNDGITCKRTESILYDKIAKLPNTLIFKNQENKGQEFTVHCLANSKEIKTKYILRVDADDTLNCLPEFKEEDKDFDILLLGKAAKNLEWLIQKGGSLNSSVFKKEIYRDAVCDHDKIKQYTQWIHEDVWYALNIFVPIYKKEKSYKITYNIGGKRVTTRGMHPMQVTNGKVISRKLHRFDTFMVWTMFYNDHAIYYEICEKLIGYDKHMKIRKGRFH